MHKFAIAKNIFIGALVSAVALLGIDLLLQQPDWRNYGVGSDNIQALANRVSYSMDHLAYREKLSAFQFILSCLSMSLASVMWLFRKKGGTVVWVTAGLIILSISHLTTVGREWFHEFGQPPAQTQGIVKCMLVVMASLFMAQLISYWLTKNNREVT
jgi:hypothetical protein